MKGHRISFFLIVTMICLLCNELYSQSANPQNFNLVTDVLPPPPNAAALTKYGGIEVALNTGMINKGITLTNFSCGNIAVPITLSYTSGGFKPSDIASRAGFGWVLNAGGVVTRTVKGVVDQQLPRKIKQNINIDSLTFDYLFGSSNNFWDTEPDLYAFNFNGVSGRFTYDDSGRITFFSASNLKIETDFTGAATWNFKITTTDGTNYFFGGPSATEKSMVEGGCGKVWGVSPEPTAWYLQKIKSAIGDSIVFSYTYQLYDYPSAISQNIYRNGAYNLTDGVACKSEQGAPQACPDYRIQSRICGSTLRVQGYLLSQITSSANGKVVFEYQTRYNTADKLYSKLKIYDQNNVVKNIYELQYDQVYTTLYSNSVVPYSYLPFLRKVIERSTDLVLTKEHKFIYNSIDSLPVEHSFSQDHWGFYNGKSNSSFVQKPEGYDWQADYPEATADREPDAKFSMRGLLSKVVYPTGGYDTIIYEANDYYGVKVINPPPTEKTNSATGTGFKDPVTVNSTNFLVSIGQAAKFQYIFIDNTGNGSYDPVHNKGTVQIINAGTNAVIFSKVSVPTGVLQTEIVYLTAGNTYKLSCTANGTAVTSNIIFTYMAGNPTTYTGNIAIGGVRVKQITTSTDSIAVMPQIKKYYYAKSKDSLSYSSGGAPATPYYIRPFSHRFACYLVPSDNPQCQNSYCGYTALQSTSTVNMNIYPSGVSYQRVIEGYGNDFENGATEHRYTLKSDQGAINMMSDPSLAGDLIPGRTYFNDSWYNGYELMNIIYKKEGNYLIPITQTENKYKVDTRKSKDIFGVIVQRRYDWCVAAINNPSFDMISAFNANLYAIQTRWMYIDTTITTQYDTYGQPATVTSQYFTYANEKHLQPTNREVSNSLTELLGEDIEYVGDYGTLTSTNAMTQGIKNLQTLNMTTVPVETVTYRRTPGSGTKRVINAKLTTFKTTVPLPDSVFLLETTTPITDFAFSTTAGGAVTKDSRYKHQLNFISYDTRGNLLNQQEVNDQPLAYIWDYGVVYPVAKVSNATVADIAYTSFETSSQGNFTVSGGSYDTVNFLTGKRSRIIGSGNTITKSGLNSSKSYIVSYWSKNGALTVNSSSAVTGITANGWTYYYHVFTGSTSVSISKSISTTIDELRLYPATALMTTATYDHLVGVTSQCDAKNMVTYYQYDKFNRLNIIRDQYRNVIKKICYTYTGQPEFCNSGVIYYNKDTTKNFTRNNCGTGYAGTVVPYTISANNYASLVSQTDADQQAAAALNANGQLNANTNGNCLLIYKNVQKQGTYTRNNCGAGFTGSSVIYTVYAGAYSSTISQGYVDTLAINDVIANGQTNANTLGSCTASNCNSGNCSGVDKKCVNGTCQTGVKVYTGYTQIGTHLYECTYHYEWSDGSWSQNYTEQAANPCNEL